MSANIVERLNMERERAERGDRPRLTERGNEARRAARVSIDDRRRTRRDLHGRERVVWLTEPVPLAIGINAASGATRVLGYVGEPPAWLVEHERS
jgi:hypothetical protein